jgi:hypothetical protein
LEDEVRAAAPAGVKPLVSLPAGFHADPRHGIEKYGETTFADPANKKYPIDTPGRIKAAWAYIHQPKQR